MCERRRFGLAASGVLSFPSNEVRPAKLSAKTGDCLAASEHPFEAVTVCIGGERGLNGGVARVAATLAHLGWDVRLLKEDCRLGQAT